MDKLYTVVFIDQDDTEDSVFEYHEAENENALETIIKDKYFDDLDDGYIGQQDDLDEEWTEKWSFTIIYSEVPTQYYGS